MNKGFWWEQMLLLVLRCWVYGLLTLRLGRTLVRIIELKYQFVVSSISDSLRR